MKFTLIQKIATYALAISASFPLLRSGEVGIFFIFFLAVSGTVGFWLEPPLTKNKDYRRWVTAALLVILAVQIVRALIGGQIVNLGMELTVALLGIKLLFRGFASDYFQIVILSFMHIIAATIAVDDLSYAVSFLLVAALSPPVLAFAYLRREMEQRFGEEEANGGPGMLGRLLNSKRVISWKFVAGSSFLSLPILIVTSVLFIFFPRMGFGFFGRLDNKEVKAGFGTEVKLGDLDITRLDETVLLRLEPFGFKDRLPSRLPIKLRGAIFDTYEGNTWKMSKPPRWRGMRNYDSLVRFDKNVILSDKSKGFHILLESMEPSLIFVPEGCGAFFTYPMAVRGSPVPRRIEENDYGSIRYDDSAKVGLRYRAYLTSYPAYGAPPGNSSNYLLLSKESGRIEVLANEFAGVGTDKQRTQNLVFALRSNYRYSLNLSSSDANSLANTPLDRFLFTRRTGTCEHFATALTLMLRAIGLPSRLITGFAGAEWNPIGEYYAVRSRFAHSWTEVFLDGRWVTLDATPPNLESVGEEQPSAISLFIDAVRMKWHKHIVGYDASSQFELAMSLWKLTRDRRSSRNTGFGLVWKPAAATLGVVLLGLIIYFVKKRWKKHWSKTQNRAVRKQDEKEASKLYMYIEHKLRNLGYNRPGSTTPLEHLQIVESNRVGIAEDLRQITHRYNEVRFGGKSFKPGEIRSLRAKIKEW